MYEKFENMSNSEISNVIDEWINGRNAERNRAILKDRIINGMLYEPLAEKYDLSVRHIKTIVYKNESVLYKHI